MNKIILSSLLMVACASSGYAQPLNPSLVRVTSGSDLGMTRVNPDHSISCEDFGSKLITDQNGYGAYFCPSPFYTTPDPADPNNPNDVIWHYLRDKRSEASKDYTIQVCEDGHVILKSDGASPQYTGDPGLPDSYYVMTQSRTVGNVDYYKIANPEMYQGPYVDPFLSGITAIVVHNSSDLTSTSIKVKDGSETFRRFQFGCSNGGASYGGSNYVGPSNF